MALVTFAFLASVAAPAAGAGEGPLLVVVEAPPDLWVDAGAIRRAIGTELEDATVAPSRMVSEAAERALLVSVDRDRITMSLRQSTATPVTRAIPAPADARARLHAIAWLAGNLVRDQVSGVVAETAAPDPALANMPALPPAEATAPAPPAAATPPDTQPPAYQPAPVPILATQAEATVAAPAPRWFITLEAGKLVGVSEMLFHDGLDARQRSISTLWRVEVRRFSQDERFLLGVSAEGSTGSYNPETVGVAGFCGWSRRRGPWQAEGTLGVGVDVGRRTSSWNEVTTTSQSSTTGVMSTTVVTAGGVGGGVYGLTAVAASREISDSTSLFMRLGAHLSAVETYDVFIWGALGVSYGLW